MKATQGTTYRMLGSRLNDAALKLEELRKIGVTGKKLNAPSDDPAAIRPVFNTRKQLSNVDRYLDTMGKSLDTMEATDGHLKHVENIMQRAKEIMSNAINGTLNDNDRTGLADELAGLRQELLAAANGTVDGKHLFAGYQEDTVPFVKNSAYTPQSYDPNDSSTWPYLYQGDENATMLEMTPGELVQINLTGNNLFFGASAWDPANPANNSTESGRYDLFLELTQAEEALRSNDQAAMQTSLGDLEGAAEQNRRLRAQLGNQAARVDATMSYQEEVRVDLKQILSRYEDANAIEAFNNILQQETAFQAALSVTSKVSQLSILDYL
ncbi:MAG: flagellar hook-associated protein FlgL [Desulfobulbus sp.]|jgi:flagellar hook-associated protein 3 FlgL|uniref:flagellar hook-associated protein FlgL n=1 Tax=Desulfobulbus sp. TaxID=895 RepID=UPI002840C8EB|nr:flagellar hook-associated protein FlgL [Desulfobulbus sp.]MDR2550740.1 flagellar hook-associated protein FlgL [Desulfobulbus sp.]